MNPVGICVYAAAVLLAGFAPSILTRAVRRAQARRSASIWLNRPVRHPFFHLF